MPQYCPALGNDLLRDHRPRPRVTINAGDAQFRPLPDARIGGRNPGQRRLGVRFRNAGIAPRRRADQQRPQCLTQGIAQPVQFSRRRGPQWAGQTGPQQPDCSPVR